ncbi:recombinase family protein [Hyphomicrobium sp. ghe19]|uniref:recombinase family protein n=1 Tax=Hyphomicrobium sp. ghe19 TaxID=2682968 RepID=UPI001366C703|nr:DNA-invertase hin [Hyphomicrobium sp. ghe19]
MRIGYARTSTIEQEAGLEAQIRDLEAARCERVYQEKVSSVAERPQLEKVLHMMRPGDVVVVTKLDRLARNVQDMWAIIKRIETEGAAIQILGLGIDTTTSTGKLMLNVMGGVAQFEREMMLERQREGIAKAKAEGKYKGRKPIADDVKARIIELKTQEHGATFISRKLGVSRSSVNRVLQELAI